jgi:WD40 repeat protein
VVEDGIKNLRVYQTFRDNTARINHMDHSHDGKLLITSSDDDSMIVYDFDKATKIQTVNLSKELPEIKFLTLGEQQKVWSMFDSIRK